MQQILAVPVVVGLPNVVQDSGGWRGIADRLPTIGRLKVSGSIKQPAERRSTTQWSTARGDSGIGILNSTIVVELCAGCWAGGREEGERRGEKDDRLPISGFKPRWPSDPTTLARPFSCQSAEDSAQPIAPAVKRYRQQGRPVGGVGRWGTMASFLGWEGNNGSI